MEFNIKNWLDEISLKIKNRFENRVLFIGYHGSYKRGEATAHSDIDMVVILDKLGLEDLKEYKKIVQSMPFSEKACGFISGRKEIENWSKSDMFQFAYETEALFGNLNEILTPLRTEDVRQAVKSSSQNLYHAACHGYLFDDDIKFTLAELFKMTFFILQADYFLKSEKYIPTKKELLALVTDLDAVILKNCVNRASIKDLEITEVDELYKTLIEWCSDKV